MQNSKPIYAMTAEELCHLIDNELPGWQAAETELWKRATSLLDGRVAQGIGSIDLSGHADEYREEARLERLADIERGRDFVEELAVRA